MLRIARAWVAERTKRGGNLGLESAGALFYLGLPCLCEKEGGGKGTVLLIKPIRNSVAGSGFTQQKALQTSRTGNPRVIEEVPRPVEVCEGRKNPGELLGSQRGASGKRQGNNLRCSSGGSRHVNRVAGLRTKKNAYSQQQRKEQNREGSRKKEIPGTHGNESTKLLAPFRCERRSGGKTDGANPYSQSFPILKAY